MAIRDLLSSGATDVDYVIALLKKQISTPSSATDPLLSPQADKVLTLVHSQATPAEFERRDERVEPQCLCGVDI